MSCCSSTLNLGCIASCDNVQTGINATSTGTYTLEINKQQVVQVSLTAGDEIIFTGGYVNEDGVTVFKIIDPDGEYVTSGDYDCFQVEVVPTTTPTLVETDCTCDYDIYINSVFSQTVTLTNCEDLTINIV